MDKIVTIALLLILVVVSAWALIDNGTLVDKECKFISEQIVPLPMVDGTLNMYIDGDYYTIRNYEVYQGDYRGYWVYNKNYGAQKVDHCVEKKGK